MEERRELVTSMLERCYGVYSGRAGRLDYELLVLAIPKFPGNIEAISTGLEMRTLVDLLKTFIANVEAKLDAEEADPVAAARDKALRDRKDDGS